MSSSRTKRARTQREACAPGSGRNWPRPGGVWTWALATSASAGGTGAELIGLRAGQRRLAKARGTLHVQMRAQCFSQGPAHVPLGWSRQSRVALRMAIVTPRRPRALASRRCPARRPRVELERAATLRPWNADSASRPPRQCDGMQTLPCGGQSEAPLLEASARGHATAPRDRIVGQGAVLRASSGNQSDDRQR